MNQKQNLQKLNLLIEKEINKEKTLKKIIREIPIINNTKPNILTTLTGLKYEDYISE